MKTANRKTIFESIVGKLIGLFRSSVPVLDRLGSFWGTRTAFLLAVGVYVLAQAYVTLPLINREIPIGGDDGYGYILKAAEIEAGCFTQNCPALNDLRTQFLTRTDNEDSAALRNREFTRLFVLYHPLHSFILAGLNSLGLSLESAFDLVYLIGKFFVPLAVVYWLKAVWGERVATTGLLLLAPVVFASQGLHYAIPTTFCLALAFLAWGIILRENHRSDFLVVILVVAMILMHSIGIFFSTIALLLYLLRSTYPLTKRAKIVAGALFAAMTGFILLQYLSSRPVFRFDTVSFYPGNWNYLASLVESLPATLTVISGFMTSFWNPLVFVILVGIGFLVLPVNQRNKITLVGVSVFGLLFLGIVYVVPWYGAFTFQRIWPIVAIFFIGAVASALNSITGSVWVQFKKTLKLRANELHHPSILLTRQGWQIAMLVMTCLILALALTSYAVYSVRNYVDATRSYDLSQDIYFSSEQPKLLNASANSEETILYMDEVTMYYFISHGSLAKGAIFQPALRFTPDLEEWIQSREDQITYVVQRNPFFYLPHSPEGALRLGSGETVILRGAGLLDTQNMQILLGARSRKVSLQISSETMTEDIVLDVEAGAAQWISLPNNIRSGNTLRIRVWLRGAETQVEIGGIRFSQNNTTRWPWGTGIRLDFKTADDQVTTIDFNPSTLAEGLINDLVVLDDFGYSILAKKQSVAP